MQQKDLLEKEERRFKRVHTTLLIFRYLLWGGLVFSILSIAALNAAIVSFHYFWNTIDLPLYLLLSLSLIIGFLLGAGFNLISYMRLNAYNRRLKQKNRIFEVEITRLKKDFSREDC